MEITREQFNKTFEKALDDELEIMKGCGATPSTMAAIFLVTMVICKKTANALFGADQDADQDDNN